MHTFYSNNWSNVKEKGQQLAYHALDNSHKYAANNYNSAQALKISKHLGAKSCSVKISRCYAVSLIPLQWFARVFCSVGPVDLHTQLPAAWKQMAVAEARGNIAAKGFFAP